jgi:hypothetical protein
MTCVQELALPQLSVTVYVRVSDPPQALLNGESLCVMDSMPL